MASLPPWVKARGQFAADCRLMLAPQTEAAGQGGQFKLQIVNKGGQRALSGVRLSLACDSGDVTISLKGNHSQVEFHEQTSGHYDLRLWRRSSVVIGRQTSSNGTRIVCDHAEVEVGADCMFSDDVLLQAADQHPIIDLKTGQVINNGLRRMVLEDHVWVGRGASLMPDVRVGRGAIVGTGAVVTRDVPPTSVVAGVPARVVRSDTTWSRQFGRFDEQSQALIDAYSSAAAEAPN